MLGKENKKPATKIPEDFNGDVEAYCQVLYEHQKSCQQSGKYIEADLAKKKLNQLKGELQKKLKDQIRKRHVSEKAEVEKAHLEQFNEFNEYWDKKMEEFETEALKIDEQTRQKHEQELKSFQADLEHAVGTKPKETSEIINLKKIEESLARQQNYQEAHQVQQQILQKERVQYQKWSISNQNRMRHLIQQLQTRQENQLNAIRQRIEGGYQQQKKSRASELEKYKLSQKYQNFVKELENQHNQQIIRFQKSLKNQSNMSVFMSKMSTMSKALADRNP